MSRASSTRPSLASPVNFPPMNSYRAASDRGHDEKENPRTSYAVGPRPEPARVVRDSSRRVATRKASSRSILESQTDQSSKGLLSIAASSVRESRRERRSRRNERDLSTAT